MKVRELFEKDPCRRIEPVIKADQRDPETLGSELDEYIVTPQIDGFAREILTEFIQSRPGRRPDTVCAWVSGWFGSGKSHFLKFLGAILADLPLLLPGGTEVGARAHLCGKWNLPFEGHLGEMDTRVVLVNLLSYVGAEAPGLAEIVYQAIVSDGGYARIPWVAEIERTLTQKGLYDTFREEVERASGLPWVEVREQPFVARPTIARALVAVDPVMWSDEEQTIRDLDAQMDLEINANWLAGRLRSEAEAIDPERGRLVLLLDEVGLYMGNVHDRYLGLKALAEAVASAEVAGKVWLVVTSQEAPEVKIQEVAAKREELEWLRDRFPVKLLLTPENIDEVVRRRLLRKTDAGNEALVRAVEANIGALATGSAIHGARRHSEWFEPPTSQAIADCYPFLPYQIHVTTEILGELRGGGEGLTGRERAILGVAQSAICEGSPNLAGEDVGPIVTLDRIFDAIVGDTRAVAATDQAEIEGLSGDALTGGVSVRSVAKALYLLQRIAGWLPTTAENIAAGLYPALGARSEEILGGVREALAALVESRYVGEQEGNYRFLSEIERGFEEEVARARRGTAARRAEIGRDALKEALEGFRRLRYRSGARVFDVRIEADGSVVAERGELRLIVSSPLAEEPLSSDEVERVDSPSAPDTAWLIADPSADLVALIERAAAMERVLRERGAEGREGAEFVQERRREMERLLHETIPSRLREGLARGTLIHAGSRRALDAATWESAVRGALEERAADIYTEFDAAAVAVRDEDAGRILTWRGGNLPTCYRELGVVGDGQIKLDGRLLSRVLDAWPTEEGPDGRRAIPLTGGSLLDLFGTRPYGWDDAVVRLALAALLRVGAVQLEIGGRVIHSFADPQALRAVTRQRDFRDAVFRQAAVLTEEERRAISRLAAEWLRETKEAPEEIDEVMRRGLGEAREHARRLEVRLRDFQLGDPATLSAFADLVDGILELPSPVLRLRRILEDDVRAAIAEGLGRVERLKTLDDAGNLERARDIRQSLDVLESVDRPRADELRAKLASDDLARVWQDVFSGYGEAIRSYGSTYTEAHGDLARRATATAEDLEQHPAAREAAEEIGRVRHLGCAEETPSVEEPPFKCPSCRRTLAELQRDLALLPQERARALARLEPPTPPGPGPIEPLQLSRKVADRDEVQAMSAEIAARLSAYLEIAIERGPVEVDVRAEPEES